MIDSADTVLTFDPHPLEILHPAALPKLIMPFSVKRDVIEGLGVAELVVIPFDEEFAQRSAEDFVEKVLLERLGATTVSVGENFRFGARAKGDPAMLESRPEFETRVVPLVEVDGETVSSTRVRAQVAAGDVAGARRCLGTPFMVEGTVVQGDQRGRELGFPTANVVPDDRLAIPGHGVYAAFANGAPAAVNVGIGRPSRVAAASSSRPTSSTATKTSTERPCASPSSSACAASAAMPASRTWSRRCNATSTRRGGPAPRTRRRSSARGSRCAQQVCLAALFLCGHSAAKEQRSAVVRRGDGHPSAAAPPLQRRQAWICRCGDALPGAAPVGLDAVADGEDAPRGDDGAGAVEALAGPGFGLDERHPRVLRRGWKGR